RRVPRSRSWREWIRRPTGRRAHPAPGDYSALEARWRGSDAAECPDRAGRVPRQAHHSRDQGGAHRRSGEARERAARARGAARSPMAEPVPEPLPAARTPARNPWSWIPTLYLAEGLPYVVVMTVSVIMYKGLGISNAAIALYTSWLYLPWVVKPLWSPVVDILA